MLRQNPGLSAGAIPSLARTEGMTPGIAVPGAFRDAAIRLAACPVRPDCHSRLITEARVIG